MSALIIIVHVVVCLMLIEKAHPIPLRDPTAGVKLSLFPAKKYRLFGLRTRRTDH